MKKENVVKMMAQFSLNYLNDSRSTPGSAAALGAYIRDALAEHTPEIAEDYSKTLALGVKDEMSKRMNDVVEELGPDNPLVEILQTMADEVLERARA